MCDNRKTTGQNRYSAGMDTRSGPSPARAVPESGLRRAGRRILWLLAIALVLVGAAVVFMSPAFYVRHVRVEGLARLTPEEAAQTQACAAVPPGTNLFRAPAKQMVVALKKLSWVADAEAFRHPPGTLEVKITPRVPVAVLSAGTGQWELDAGGVVIRSARPGLNLPEIADANSPDVRPGQLVNRTAVVEAVSAVLPEGRQKPIPVTKIEVDQNEELCLNMRDRVVIRLGQIEDLPAKLALVHRIYEDPEIGSKVEAIDLRCPEAPACVPRAAAKESPQDAHSRSRRHRRSRSSRVPSRPSAD
jgi:cell division septal protein FtsQ